ncbi:MAG: hypothetical protein K9I68_05705 [Bacteroidales bacterium]|nr:hypothetical protein [Bacteroidales bacterium]MCF8308487.1 hypothetical protein [Bacteroidales bacterium]
MACHSNPELTKKRNGKEISLYVNEDQFTLSKHGILGCVDCHQGFDPQSFPHKKGEKIYQVDCSICHATDDFKSSVHGGNADCHQCHSKHSISAASEIKENIEQVCSKCHQRPDIQEYQKSIHHKSKDDQSGASCIECHNNSAHQIQPVKENKKAKNKMCSDCHNMAVEKYEKSLHGTALEQEKHLAPSCVSCHGSHGILPSDNEKAKTYIMNIPSLCGECHKEGTKVSELQEVRKKHVLEDYSQSIHGHGLFERGLTVTAVCNSCHNSHEILHSENPESSINKNNIPNTCMRCHAQIESVHKKIIRGELWEKQPDAIPVCVECHKPHEVRNVFYNENFPDESCMYCHKREDIYKIENGERINLTVDDSHLENSAHSEQACIKCHTDVSNAKSPVCENSGKVDCSICHSEEVENYEMSKHGQLVARGKEMAPGCTDCHGRHKILSGDNTDSPIFPMNIPKLCGECHKKGETAAKILSGEKKNIVKDYRSSIHGKGLLKSGLLVTATCVDCHTKHMELPADDPMSSVHENNINKTCSNCHLGVYEKFQASIHSSKTSDTEKDLPRCNDCHLSHSIERVDHTDFRQKTLFQCGKCHNELTDRYFETFHGKVSKLGSAGTAKCHDCHGAHNILPPENPKSTLSRENIIETCRDCHPNSNRKFAGYLTHATHHNKEKYKYLYYTYLIMTILLVSVFIFFGTHTLLWLSRGLIEKRKEKKERKRPINGNNQNNDDK